jgi:NTP pyrophosphatase (non-canonical NTP hydrolase)|tara:strand:+ start:9 stop:338 length:330 start_codon:yes stop_codon:yes gene_type:complete
MNFDEYQEEAMQSAIYPNLGNNYEYPAFGLAEEVGEVLGKIAKVNRDQKGVFVEKNIQDIQKEMGDVLWMLSALASEFKISLEGIAYTNLKKLNDRQYRGVLRGSGDNR